MPRQLALDLRTQRRTASLSAFDAGFPINWRAVDRQARRFAAAIAAQNVDGVRTGFAIRRYADDAALLETLRARRSGKQLKRAVRNTGRRLPSSPAVLMAMTSEGRRLHALAAKLEARLTAREAVALCG